MPLSLLPCACEISPYVLLLDDFPINAFHVVSPHCSKQIAIPPEANDAAEATTLALACQLPFFEGWVTLEHAIAIPRLITTWELLDLKCHSDVAIWKDSWLGSMGSGSQ